MEQSVKGYLEQKKLYKQRQRSKKQYACLGSREVCLTRKFNIRNKIIPLQKKKYLKEYVGFQNRYSDFCLVAYTS